MKTLERIKVHKFKTETNQFCRMLKLYTFLGFFKQSYQLTSRQRTVKYSPSADIEARESGLFCKPEGMNQEELLLVLRTHFGLNRK